MKPKGPNSKKRRAEEVEEPEPKRRGPRHGSSTGDVNLLGGSVTIWIIWLD